ncbi:amidohydrolase family protein [Streptomyces sp. TP-A0874]|uniref:amidohydrolase family protein n=1 Tax=Streptomyces sp. TP-A0874 TaxID=549819 RepID=UPI0008537232|nr:amidohydrolase family protein [Streptomyces sp. TP-A0874]
MPDSLPQPPGHEGASPRSDALLLCNARLVDGRTVDVRLSGGRIEAVGTAGSLARGSAPPATGARPPAADAPGGSTTAALPPAGPGARLDLTGHLLLPAPAEPHAHGDTAFTAEAGPLRHTPAEVRRRVAQSALLQLSHGVTAVRSHVRMGDLRGLASLEAALEAGRALRGLTDLSVVALPRLLTGVAGADALAMLRDAVKMGAAVIGGCPDVDPDPTGYVEAVLDLAAEYGCPVDLHTDGDDPARLARLAAMAGSLRPSVTIGPCTGPALFPHQTAARTADRLAAAGVTVVCLPQGRCTAMEGDRLPPAGTCLPPVRLLRSAGVRVVAGSGALRDAANPVGRGDPLEAAYLLAAQSGERPVDAYAAVSSGARAAMGLPEVRVEAGFPAELLAVRGEQLAGVLSLGYSRVVVHDGRVVSRTSAVREYCDPTLLRTPDLPRQGRSAADDQRP